MPANSTIVLNNTRKLLQFAVNQASPPISPISSGFRKTQRNRCANILKTLRLLSPEMASFYLLTPIPGTEQYTDFLERGFDHGTEPGPV